VAPFVPFPGPISNMVPSPVPFPTDPVSNASLVRTGKDTLKATGVSDQDVQLTVRTQTLEHSSTRLTLHASPT